MCIFLSRVSLETGVEGLLWTGPDTGAPEAGPVDLPPEGNVPDENAYYDDVRYLSLSYFMYHTGT